MTLAAVWSSGKSEAERSKVFLRISCMCITQLELFYLIESFKASSFCFYKNWGWSTLANKNKIEIHQEQANNYFSGLLETKEWTRQCMRLWMGVLQSKLLNFRRFLSSRIKFELLFSDPRSGLSVLTETLHLSVNSSHFDQFPPISYTTSWPTCNEY